MSGMRARQGGYGFAINYDREIKADHDLVTQMTRLIENRWFHPATMVKDGIARDISSYSISLIDLALMDVKVTAAQLGLSLDDLSDIAYAADRDFSSVQLDGSVVELPHETPGAYKRGEVIVDRLEAIWAGDLYTEELLRKVLKKAKADLARHKRNKAKHDPVER